MRQRECFYSVESSMWYQGEREGHSQARDDSLVPPWDFRVSLVKFFPPL